MTDQDTRSRLRRIRLLARQRGLKETCVLLGDFACTRLTEQDTVLMDTFECLLEWSDQEILAWILQIEPPPEALAGIISMIATLHDQPDPPVLGTPGRID